MNLIKLIKTIALTDLFLFLQLMVLHLAALYGYHSYDKLKEIGRVIAASNAETQQQTANLNV